MPEPSLLRHVAAFNRVDPSRFVPFAIGLEAPIGSVRRDSAAHLVARRLAQRVGEGLHIPEGGFAETSRRLAEMVAALAEAGLMARPRQEMTPVMRAWGRPPLAMVDRAGLPALGLPAYGVHVNGIVRNAAGLHLWVGRRAMDRQVAPGKYDHIVAGGLPFGHSADETLVKEAAEEAGLPAEIAHRAVPVGIVSYRLEMPEGLRNDVLFVYDLEVPAGVVPANSDGEVAAFELWPIAQVLDRLRRTDDFKFNVNLVLIDFLVRHGVLRPDGEPDYVELVRGLRE